MEDMDIIPPPYLFEIYGRLRCRLIKNSPRRTSSTPAGVFYSLLASVSPISRRQTENLFSKVSILFRSANTIYTNSKNYLPLANTHRPTLVDTISILFASAYINSG